MARFNKIKVGTATQNLAGGDGYKSTPELELTSILLTSFLQDSYYEKSAKRLDRLDEILKKVDPEFAAKAAIYARKTFGMRSITHVLASKIAKYASGKPWAKRFYHDVINRPDDMAEILSHYRTHSKSMPNAMKKGFARYLRNMQEYHYAKYSMANKDISLVDLVNLTHPKPTLNSYEALRKLVEDGTVSSASKTWEASLSATKGDAKAKKDTWIQLLRANNLGYFAALRNVRNIVEQAPEAVDELCVLLGNPQAIKASKVMPFRFVTAYNAVQELPSSDEKRKVIVAITTALERCLSNIPNLPGKTLLMLDTSGSMYKSWSYKNFNDEVSAKSPIGMAAIFAAAMYKRMNADLLLYSNDVAKVSPNPMDSIMTIAGQLCQAGQKGGTNLGRAFDAIKHHHLRYDRIIVLSDMQSWMSSVKNSFYKYKTSLGVDPYLYSMDFKGYGTLEFPENNVVTLAGYSDKLFDLFEYTEQDKRALINKIKSYEWSSERSSETSEYLRQLKRA